MIASFIVTLVLLSIVIAYNVKSGFNLANPYTDSNKRWNENELFIAAYVAVFIEKDIRLNNEFQQLLALVLRRTERAASEKIRRMNTVGSRNSDASAKDFDTILEVAQMDQYDAAVQFEENLILVGATRHQLRTILGMI